MTSEYIVFPTTQMGSCVEPNWTVLYDKILGLENQVTKISWQMQELCDGRITTIEDETAKLKQTILKWQSFSDVEFESESEIDTKTDSGGDFMGHIHPADAICISDAASTEQADTSDFIGNNTLDLGREGRGSLIQQESCSAKVEPQSEANRPNPLGEGNELVDANPSFSPGLVQHYRDQEGLHNNTVPKRLNGETAREETTPKGVASAAVGGDKPPGEEPRGGDCSSGTGLKLTQNIPQMPQIPENSCAECTVRQDAERRNGERHCNGQSTNTKRDFKKYIEDGNKKLENRNRKALRENLCYLICYLQPVIDDVALYMFSHLVLSDRQREKIASKTTETEKCEHLVTKVLLHSSEKTFWVFMQALEDNNCEFIVDQLLGKANVTGHIRAIVDILEERRTSEDAQRCLQVVLHTIDEYIFNNPDISRPMADAIRNTLAELNLIVTGLFRGSILMNLTFYTVEQLDAFWMWVKTQQPSPLSMSLTEVILTEEIRNMVQEDLILSLSTDMDLDEYLKKRRRLLHGDLPMTSDDSNFGKRPLKERNQSLLWLDIAGQPKMEANPKVLLEWAYESGYKDPLPLLTEKFPQTFTGYNEKDFRIERLHKLIIYQNGRISQMNEKCEELENNLLQTATDLKKAQDTLEEKNQFIKILTDKLLQITMRESNGELLKWQYPSNAQTNINSIVGIGTQSIETHPKPAVPVPNSEGSVVQVRTQKTNSDDLKQPNDSGLQASGGHAEEHFDNEGDFPEERMYGERVRGLSTVICVDTSGSMEGEAFTDMKSAIHKILDDAEYTNNVYDFKELIGLVECGSGSDGRTVVSLTDNYDRIRRALGCLRPSGMSPLATGIREAVHEVKRHSGVLVVSRQMVPSRLLIFTDGIPTDENDYGSTVDLTRASTAGKYKVMTAVQRPFNDPVALQARINFVGCGKRCDRVFLENAAKAGKGKFFRADDKLDVRRLGGYYRRLVWVCRFICPFREKEFINQLVNTKNTFSTWMRATKSTEIFDTDLSDFDMDEMYEILQELIGPKALTDLDVEDLQRTALIQRELPLGIRVRRGPDWENGDQDNNGPGTVSGYEKGGWVRVQWDHSNEDFVYRYGHDGRREVQAVDEPRILMDDEFIKPGVKVRRGPHWNAGNNDGGPGSIGTVYKVEEAGIVYVLWPTRVASNHRYGYDGRFEVELVEESTQHEGDEDGSGFITDDGKVALWQWNSNGNWTAYPKYVNTKLERSYRIRPSTSVEVNVAGLCQRINFESMTALCTDINETYEIQRTELSLEDFEAVRVGLEGY